jgi:hypothetical protein
VTIRRMTGAELFAVVADRTSTRLVRWQQGPEGWTCNCPRLSRLCPHILAVQRVVDVDDDLDPEPAA